MTPDEVRALIAHRCPELSDADLAWIEARSQPAETASAEAVLPDDMVLPLEVVDRIVEVIDALEQRMTRLEAQVAHAGEDVVEACRRAIVDLDVEEKAAVVDQLRGWVELERASHDPTAAPERQH